MRDISSFAKAVNFKPLRVQNFQMWFDNLCSICTIFKFLIFPRYFFARIGLLFYKGYWILENFNNFLRGMYAVYARLKSFWKSLILLYNYFSKLFSKTLTIFNVADSWKMKKPCTSYKSLWDTISKRFVWDFPTLPFCGYILSGIDERNFHRW